MDQVTNGELSIIQVRWRRGEATSREITGELHEELTDPKIASVQKLIERLEGKGCIRRDRSERAHRFRPIVGHSEYLQSRLQALADRLCGGAVTPLVTTLLQSEQMSGEERAELRRLIGDLWSTDSSSD